MRYLLLTLFAFAFLNSANSQTSADLAVMVTATTSTSPDEITLNWPSAATSTSYAIHRKLKSESAWGASYATLTAGATSFTDTVTVGKSYEYRVRQNGTSTAYGYINAGIDVPSDQLENRGVFILIIEEELKDSLISEIAILENDIKGDGWQVRTRYVSNSEPDTAVKEIIKGIYNDEDAKALFILGHVAVPYSGNLNPDAHTDHKGAWPADAYYAELTSFWTDMSVNNTTGSRTQTHNIPGDGKYDQSTIPSEVELEMGRADFANLPTFSESAVQLTRQYLNKLHDYKVGTLVTVQRALIDDNFGFFSGEAFGQSGWRNFGTLVGEDSIYSKLNDGADYFTDLATTAYQWAYGCGGGSYNSCGGVGNTGNFAATDVQSIFNMLFGSYFGDWDASNNFLRAALASGDALTNAWAGRPHWFFHHMGLGSNIGYSTRLSQNNPGGYAPTGFSVRGVHVALMGDPSLRQHIIKPPSSLMVSETSSATAQLTWSASPETVLGYNVYRAVHPDSAYIKVNGSVVTGTSFEDIGVTGTTNYYYSVRAVRLNEGLSGSYNNLSLAAFGDVFISSNVQDLNRASLRVYPNPTNGIINIDYRNIGTTANLRVISITGKIVLESNKADKILDLTGLSSGFYVLQLIEDGAILDEQNIILQ